MKNSIKRIKNIVSSLYQTPYLLIVTLQNPSTEKELSEKLRKIAKQIKLKEKNSFLDATEITYEVWPQNTTSNLISTVYTFQNVEKVSLIDLNGEYVI